MFADWSRASRGSPAAGRPPLSLPLPDTTPQRAGELNRHPLWDDISNQPSSPPSSRSLLAPSLLSVLSYVYLCMWFTFTIVLEGCCQHGLSDSTRLSPELFLLCSDSLTVQYLLHQRQVLSETKICCRFKVSLYKHFSGPAPSNDTHAAYNKSAVLQAKNTSRLIALIYGCFLTCPSPGSSSPPASYRRTLREFLLSMSWKVQVAVETTGRTHTVSPVHTSC